MGSRARSYVGASSGSQGLRGAGTAASVAAREMVPTMREMSFGPGSAFSSTSGSGSSQRTPVPKDISWTSMRARSGRADVQPPA